MSEMKTTGNIFEGIPAAMPEELFDTLLGNQHLCVERIVSRGHTSPAEGWYDQARHEWVMVLQGEATITFEDGRVVSLKKGDYLNIPAHTRHRVSHTAAEIETLWLAIHYE